MKLEYKDALKEIRLETLGESDTTDAIDVISILMDKKKSNPLPKEEQPKEQVKHTSIYKGSQERRLPPLCFVECDAYNRCNNQDKSVKNCTAMINRIKNSNKCIFPCGYSINLNEEGLEEAKYTCECGETYDISCYITEDTFTAYCRNCGSPIEIKWNAKKKIFDRM